MRLLLLITSKCCPNLQFLHVPHRLGEIIIIAAAMDAGSHHIACCRATRIEAFLRQPFTYDIAVGRHSNELIVLSDGNGAYIMLAHQFRELDNRSVGTNPFNTLVHRFFDFHGGAPLLENVGTCGILP